MEFEIIDPHSDSLIVQLKSEPAPQHRLVQPFADFVLMLNTKLHQILTKRKTITIPESGVKLLASRNYENRTSDVSEEEVYRVTTSPVPVLRATIVQICTKAGSAGTLQSTLTWTPRTLRPTPPAKSLSPTDVDLTTYGDVQAATVPFAAEGIITFQSQIVGGAGDPEYSAWLRLEEIQER